ECAACAATAHHPCGSVDRGRAGRVWVVWLREGAFWIRAALHCARPGEAAGISAQTCRSSAVEARSDEDLRIFQRRQRHGKNPWNLSAAECFGEFDLPAVDGALE